MGDALEQPSHETEREPISETDFVKVDKTNISQSQINYNEPKDLTDAINSVFQRPGMPRLDQENKPALLRIFSRHNDFAFLRRELKQMEDMGKVEEIINNNLRMISRNPKYADIIEDYNLNREKNEEEDYLRKYLRWKEEDSLKTKITNGIKSGVSKIFNYVRYAKFIPRWGDIKNKIEMSNRTYDENLFDSNYEYVPDTGEIIEDTKIKVSTADTTKPDTKISILETPKVPSSITETQPVKKH